MDARFRDKVAIATGATGGFGAAIAFLASEDAKFVTGASLAVDGGRLARL